MPSHRRAPSDYKQLTDLTLPNTSTSLSTSFSHIPLDSTQLRPSLQSRSKSTPTETSGTAHRAHPASIQKNAPSGLVRSASVNYTSLISLRNSSAVDNDASSSHVEEQEELVDMATPPRPPAAGNGVRVNGARYQSGSSTTSGGSGRHDPPASLVAGLGGHRRRTTSMQTNMFPTQPSPYQQHPRPSPQPVPMPHSRPSPNAPLPPRPDSLRANSSSPYHASRPSLDIGPGGIPAALSPPGARVQNSPHQPFFNTTASPPPRTSPPPTTMGGPSRPLPPQSLYPARPRPLPPFTGGPLPVPAFSPGAPNHNMMHPPGTNGWSNPPHGQPGHMEKDCDQCESVMDKVFAASRESAEEEVRKRSEIEAEEEAIARRVAQQTKQEDDDLQRALQESLALSQEQEQRDRERREEEKMEQRVMEESKVHARLEEEEKQRKSQAETEATLERSRVQAMEDERRRKEWDEIEQEIEARVLEESRLEQEREWRRREEEERVFLQSIQAENRGEASMWQRMQNDEAFALAFEAQRRYSVRRPRRQRKPSLQLQPPLPAVPRAEMDARRPSDPMPASPDEIEALADPFGDAAEAPPMYDDVAYTSSGSTASSSQLATRPPLISRASEPGPVTAVAQQLVQDSASRAPARPPAAPASVSQGSIVPAARKSSLSASTSPVASPIPQPAAPSRQGSGGALPSRPLPRLPGLQNLLQPLVQPAGPTATGPIELDDASSIRSGSIHSIHENGRESARSHYSGAGVTPSEEARGATPSPSLYSFNESIFSVDSSSSSVHGSRPSRPSLSTQSSASVPPEAPSREATSSPISSATFGQRPSASSASGIPRFEQKTPQGVDWGYAAAPFAPELYASPDATSVVEGKGVFPSLITLRAPSSSGKSPFRANRSAYFVIRAQTWKALLRAMAWFGNSRVEAGPEEVADAAAEASKTQSGGGGQCRLKLDVEFVTPTRWDVALESIEPHAKESGMYPSAKPARVAVCLSLVQNRSAAISSVLAVNNRELDTYCLQRGSARKALILPSRPPTLPISVVDLAQHMHATHAFSAACPSSSTSSISASPRDLHIAVEKHDVKYFAKRRKEAAARTGAPLASFGDDPTGLHQAATGDFEHRNALDRMKGKVKKLVKRKDDQALNEDLSTWITPLDLSEYG